MTVPPGVSVAFGNTPFDEDPTWTRLDTHAGIHIDSIQIKRGRADEWTKAAIGTCTLTGYDTTGVLDPTNTGGAFYGDLDPLTPAAVSLWNPVTNAWSYLFNGYTADLALTLDVSEKKLDVQWDWVDMLDLLTDAEVIPDSSGNTAPAESTGDTYYTGQHVDDRILAVLADSSTALLGKTFPAGKISVFSGNVNVQGSVYSNKTAMIDVIDEATDAEFPSVATRFITKSGVFQFLGRYAYFDPSGYGSYITHWKAGDIAAATADDTNAVINGLQFARGKTNLVNCVLCTPYGIAASDISSQFVSDSTSVDRYGPRVSGMSLENLRTGDSNDDGNNALAETYLYGIYIVDNYKVPQNRVSQLVFRNPPAGASSARASAQWNLLCGLELQDYITLTTSHPGGGGFAGVDFFVASITYDLKPLRGDQWDVTLTVDTIPRAFFSSDPFVS